MPVPPTRIRLPEVTQALYDPGVSYQATVRRFVGEEVLHHNFRDLGRTSGPGADADTLMVRASLRT